MDSPPVRHGDCVRIGGAAIARRDILAITALSLATGLPRLAQASPHDLLTWAVHISLAPTWFDPAETSGIITPYMMLYALHDAMVKPMPGRLLAPSLAESWEAPEDGLSYEFTLRPDLKFHNGEAVTTEDVRFSFERYRGASSAPMKERVAAIETPDARHLRFKLKGTVAGFSDLLRQRHRRRLGGAENVP